MSDNVYDDVKKERDNQDSKWGQTNHHPLEWLCILGEGVGEANKAACEAHFSGYQRTGYWEHYREELIQVAAVAVAMVQSFDRNGSPKGK